MNVLNRIAGVFTQFVTPVYVLRAPLLTAMLAVVALAVPDQTLELYRAIALDRADRWPQILLAYTTLTLAGAMLWYIGRTMTLRWQRAQLVESTISGFLLRWLPRLYGAAPLSGAAIGIFKSASLAKPLDPSQWREGAGAIPEVVESIAVAIRQYETASSLLYFGASVALGLGILAFALGRALAYAGALLLVGSCAFLALIPRWRTALDDDRSLPALVESLLDPNRVIDERYQTYTATTDEGLVHTGILIGETAASITLLEQQGKVYTLLRRSLDDLVNSRLSLMPEGFERDLSQQDVADVLAYVAGQGQPALQVAGEPPSDDSTDAAVAISTLLENLAVGAMNWLFGLNYGVRGRFAILQHVEPPPVRRIVDPHVIGNHVEQDRHARVVGRRGELTKIVDRAERGIDHAVIDDVVAVGAVLARSE